MRGWVGAAAVVLLGGFSPAVAQGQELRGHGGPVRAVAAFDGGLVTGGFDSALIVWEIGSGAASRVLRFHDSTVNALVALDDKCFASGGEDARIAIWCGGLKDGKAEPVRVLTGHRGPISALALSTDGRQLASAAWDRTVRLWSLDDKAAAPRVVEGHQGPVNGISYLRDGSGFVTAGYDGQIRLEFLTPGRAPLMLQLAAPVNAVAISPDGEIVTAGADGTLRFFDRELKPTGELMLPAGPLTTVAMSPDGSAMATAGMRTPVTLIDRQARSVRSEILGPGLPIWSLAYSPDGRHLYTGGADRAVRRWDAATGKPIGGAIAPGEDSAPASAPAERGAQVFRACRACHGLKAEDVNRAGPTLHGVFGRRIATAPGYVYSDALKGMPIVWNADTISRLFEIGPNAYTPGTKMPEQTISDPADRKALVDWLAKVTTE